MSVWELPFLGLAFVGFAPKPQMPAHCPSRVDDGGMSRSFKARTYDTHLILNRNEVFHFALCTTKQARVHATGIVHLQVHVVFIL